MKYILLLVTGILISCSLPAYPNPDSTQNYEYYHQQVILAEKLIAEQRYHDALLIYEHLFNSYDFVFLREYQVATQLALQINHRQKAIEYLKKGIAAGWSKKSIKQNKFLKNLLQDAAWKAIRKEYPRLHKQFEARLDQSLRKQVRKMFAKDQWKALGALLTFSSKRQDTYAERKFAPHSERQMEKLISMLDHNNYPGEKAIGNNYWMATILSHHNSISTAYNQKDTIYLYIKPKLLAAMREGKLSPGEFAMIDDWYLAVKSNRTEAGYGALISPTQKSISQVNELRQKAGLCTVETRNRLVDIESQTGMNLYLPGRPWLDGKISITE